MSKKPRKIVAGVTFDPDVVAYLNELGEQEDRSRSWLINAIVRAHAEQSGYTPAKKKSKRAPRR